MNHQIATTSSTVSNEISSGNIYVMGILEKICKALSYQ